MNLREELEDIVLEGVMRVTNPTLKIRIKDAVRSLSRKYEKLNTYKKNKLKHNDAEES